MFTSDVVEPVEGGKKHLLVSLLLLGGLLFLRFPFLIAGTLLLPQGPGVQGAMFFSFTIGTYLITAVLIWWERERLRDFRIDLAAAITFLLQLYCFPIGIGLFAAMRRKRARFPRPPANVWRWALVGAILAIACNILAWKLGIEPASSRTAQPASFSFLIPALLTQTTWAAVWEEPLFRGFLWGYLRLARWQEGWIWLFQALLFTLGHVYYLQNEAVGPWFLRLMLPSLLIGFIAWRAKSIFASMVTHGMINASNDMLFHTRSLSEALRFSGSVIVILLAILALLWFGRWILQKGIKPDANTR
jgi:membrane protease YdiL (CAAX protease family)